MSKIEFFESFEQLKGNWVPTAIELWNDKKFVERRIREQWDYQTDIALKWKERPTVERYLRYRELLVSSDTILIRFQNRLKELNGLVAQSGERKSDILEGNGS